MPTTPRKRKADLRNLEEPDATEGDSHIVPCESTTFGSGSDYPQEEGEEMEVDTGATYSLTDCGPGRV